MATRPNVLVMTSHDTGRHFGCYGVGTVETTAIDTLAAEGCRFTRAFTVSPVCSPSRAATMTGRYPQSNGVFGLTHQPYNWSLHPDERHLARLLRDAGYYTALFGHQHEANDSATLGFHDRFLEHREGRRPHEPGSHHPGVEIARRCAAFLRERGRDDAPFYAQVGFFETHEPFGFSGAEPDARRGVFVPPYLVSDAVATTRLAALQGAVRTLDAAVGIITHALAKSGHDRDTIVVFTVDHGIPFTRAKLFCYDPGLEIALIIRWPNGGIGGGRTCDWLTSNVDLLPSLLDLLGLPVPDTVQGRSFAPFFAPTGAAPPRDAVFAMLHQFNEFRCIRTTRHKLIRSFRERRRLRVPVDLTKPEEKAAHPFVELFDLAHDPHEFTNLADDPDYAADFAALDARLWHWLEAVDDPILRGPVPTPYYRDAIAAHRVPAPRSPS